MPSPCNATSPRISRLLDERGLTLVEVTIVVVLASLVMLALLGFYINSQATWNDASSQTITQRELTMVIERITEKAHMASQGSWDAAGNQLDLYPPGSPNAFYTLRWDQTDSLLYESGTNIAGGEHPILGSRVMTFQVACVDSVLVLSNLTLRTAAGKFVSAASTMTFMNRP